MNSNVAVFNKDGFTARTITDDNGEIWFVAKDIAQALGYPESSLNQVNNLFGHVPPQWAGHKRIMVNLKDGRKQEREMLCLSEQGVYFFLGRSDKKAALPYQMWVAGEVVPSIRKHGFYATPAKVEEILQDPDNWIKVLEAYKAECEKVKKLEAEYAQQLNEKNALAAKVEEDKPKVIFAESVEASEGSILIGELAKILRQNGVNVGEIRLFKWMRDNGYLCKARGEDWNLPTQRAMDNGLFKIKKTAVNDPNKGAIVRRTPKVTGKGQIYFVNGFRSGRFVI